MMPEHVDVPVSARTGVPLHRTVRAFLASDDDDDKIELGMCYVRRVFALLFLQFMAIGMIISPFCLIDSIQHLVKEPYIMLPLNFVSFLGLFLCVYAVASRGNEKWAARTGLFGGTFFFAVALGAKLALLSWAKYALVAIGQATCNFALLHAVSQFVHSRNDIMQIRMYSGGFALCFVVGCLWVLLMREAGCSWLIAATVPLGGWLFAVHIILSVRKSTAHREPNDYLRAVIFILGPPIPDCLILKKPSARGRWAAIRARHHLQGLLASVRHANATQAEEEKQEKEGLTENNAYGAVDSVV